METVDFDSILILLQASSKETVLKIVETAFKVRNEINIPSEVVNDGTVALTAGDMQITQLHQSLAALIRKIIYYNLNSAEEVLSLFPKGFHDNLKNLLTRIIIEHLEEWKRKVVNNQISLPKLNEFDWRVDIKAASNNVMRMSVPTCLLKLQVADDKEKDIVVELSKETLDTMLHGLGTIRSQLSSVS